MADFESTVRGISRFLSEQDTGGYSPSPPLTDTASSHSITIRTNNGLKIARIQSWSPAITRTIDAIYEVGKFVTGEPVERIPQILTTNRISVNRYELYNKHIGEAFGAPTAVEGDLISLAGQLRPFNTREIWRDPFLGIRAYVYVGCWFSDWGITIDANDDRIIKANATLEFTRRLRLQ